MGTEEQEDNNDSKATQLQMIEAEFTKMYCSAAYFDNVLHWSVCILSSVLTERLSSWAVLSDIVLLLSNLLYIYVWTDPEDLKYVTYFKCNT